MSILSQQQVATFPIWGQHRINEEVVLWQPEEATRRESRVLEGVVGAISLIQYEIADECPWTDEMVLELWCRMIQETDNKSKLLGEEIRRWEELDELVKAEVVDINEPSYFNEWDQTKDLATLIRNDKGEAQKFTPEMLVQRENLNWLYNIRGWNESKQLGGSNDEIADQLRVLEVVSLGENFGLAKCEEGSVFLPKSTLKHIRNVSEKQQGEYYENNSLAVGSKFEALITFTGVKYPWRVTFQGVTNIY
jgi:hypothetical protein